MGQELDRVKSDELLRESELRFRVLFSSIDEGYCLAEIVTDAVGQPVDYRFLEVNRLFEEMTGLVDPVGKRAYEMTPDLPPAWPETYARVALQGEQLRFEQDPDAMHRSFDVFTMPVEPRGRFVIVCKDQTTRRRTEDALRQSEELFRNMSDISPPADLDAGPRRKDRIRKPHVLPVSRGHSRSRDDAGMATHDPSRRQPGVLRRTLCLSARPP
jgi:PAS domain-containing protein